MDIMINGTLVARGEVVSADGKFGLRLVDVVSPKRAFEQLAKHASSYLILLTLSPDICSDMVPAVSPSSLFTGDYLLQVVGSFVVVILLLVAAVLVMLKRFNGVSSSMSGDMRVISSAGVSQRERAVLLQVGEQQLLVGVAPGNVRTLHVFDEPAIEASEQSAPSFADVWKVATGKAETSS